MKQLEFTTLKLFVAVADAGSLSGAAEQCSIAIAAVSKRISDMEAATGSQFFYRHARGMSLTPAGRALLLHAREIIFSVDRMHSDLREYSQGVKGLVRVAATSSAVIEFMPDELKLFAQAHPNIAIDLAEWTSQKIIDAVLEGRADLGIFIGPSTSDELVTFPYHEDQLCVVVPNGHPLTIHKSVRFADVLKYDIIASNAQSSISQRLMAEGGAELKVRMNVGSSDAICKMVAVGLGIGIGPLLVVEAYAKTMNVQLIALDEPWARREMLIGIRSEEGLSGAAKTLLAHCIAASKI